MIQKPFRCINNLLKKSTLKLLFLLLKEPIRKNELKTGNCFFLNDENENTFSAEQFLGIILTILCLLLL
jgi:hypothetical protein